MFQKQSKIIDIDKITMKIENDKNNNKKEIIVDKIRTNKEETIPKIAENRNSDESNNIIISFRGDNIKWID